MVDAGGTTKVRAGEFPIVGPDIWLIDKYTVVDVGSPESAIQTSGHCGFRVAGIRAGVLPSVLPDKIEDSFPITDDGNKQGCYPGRDIIENIINTSRTTSEIFVFGIFVTDHRVEGIDHFISHHSGKSAERVKEKRGNDAVA